MTTMGCSRDCEKNGGMVLALLALACIVAAVWWMAGLMAQVNAPVEVMRASVALHAVERHGMEAANIIQCIEGGGTMEIWLKPDGREMHVCELNGKFGVAVMEGERYVTAFMKSKMGKIEQVIRYLENCGAIRVWP